MSVVSSNDWLTADLVKETKDIFEIINKKQLTDKEAVEIALRLADFFELFMKNENKTTRLPLSFQA
jgi:hypothetical protein